MKKKIKIFFRQVLNILAKPEMMILPGQLAFYFVLAIVPIITLITYGASFLNLSYDFIFNFLSNAFSSDLANLLLSTDVVSSSNGNIFLILFIALLIASNGSASIIVTSNTIYGIKSKRFFRRRIKSFIMTFIMIFLIVFILIVPVFGNSIVGLIQYMDINESLANTIIETFRILSGPVNWFLIFLIIKLIYTIAPDKEVASRNVNYGAIFTTFCWILGTYVYSWYINNIANYNAFYGALTNVVILMLWFYYLAYVFTIGMALNYHKEEEELERTEALKIIKEQ